MQVIRLEICANSVASAIAAEKGGAARVELCDNLHEGGTTPSYGAIQLARDELSIQLYPIIRPRGGDFLYDDQQMEIMWQDIAWCKQVGCDGVVIGLLNAVGDIDVRRTKLLVEWAWPLGVTFHRAFDRCRAPLDALEDVIATGCERILTSGQGVSAVDGAELISQLVEKAGDRIQIMAGSGVRAHNVADLVKKTRCTEYHSRAQKTVKSKMSYQNELVRLLGNIESEWEETDPGEVADLLRRAEEAWELAFPGK